MTTDDPLSSAGAVPFGRKVRGLLSERHPELAAFVARGPRAVATAAVVLCAAAAVAWWLLRPAPHPPVETLLPRASASSGATGATAATGAAGGSGAAGAAPASGVAGVAGSAGTAAVLVVHVVGAVVRPGVVQVPAGSRVLDAVAAAGGVRLDADTARMNLAARLTDGQRVAVPVIGEPPPVASGDPSGGAGGAVAAGPGPAAPLDVNLATEAELDVLPGVGPATAAAIVAHRSAHGRFRSVDALGEVRGIGPAKLEALRPLVTVGS
jgi:competence protein ComEA